MNTTIVWFRRDLRLVDHAALAAALKHGGGAVCVYIDAPDEDAPWQPGAASRWWLHHSLRALRDDLASRGASLVIRRGPSAEALIALARETGATRVAWQRLYEPVAVARDDAVRRTLRDAGIASESHAGALLFEPGDVATAQGDPYKVFTPFWKRAREALVIGEPRDAPAHISSIDGIASLSIDDLALLPRIRWDDGLAASWTPGEAGAHARLDGFLANGARDYATDRDRPDHAGTSRLSPHLHFGEISPRQVIATIAARGLLAAGEPYVRQLGWREFSQHILAHFPHIDREPFNPQYIGFDWATLDDDARDRWRRGRTGIPIVDAGMRELWTTGWMHNRVRMLVASFLTKNLRGHWLDGARWFWDTLVDADLPNNTQGWQWTAGCGTDAAPYFRVFNPVTQGERFDPNGDYVRRHVAELANVPAGAIHRPWTLDADMRRRLAGDYPAPMVDLAASRDAALAAWRAMRG